MIKFNARKLWSLVFIRKCRKWIVLQDLRVAYSWPTEVFADGAWGIYIFTYCIINSLVYAYFSSINCLLYMVLFITMVYICTDIVLLEWNSRDGTVITHFLELYGETNSLVEAFNGVSRRKKIEKMVRKIRGIRPRKYFFGHKGYSDLNCAKTFLSTVIKISGNIVAGCSVAVTLLIGFIVTFYRTLPCKPL